MERVGRVLRKQDLRNVARLVDRLLLQAILLNAPVLAIFSRGMERVKRRYFDPPPLPDPSPEWIASAIAAAGLVLVGFLVASGELATERLSQALSMGVTPQARVAIMDATISWKLSVWTGMVLTLAGSLGGIFLAYFWSRVLFREVRARTAELHESEQRFAPLSTRPPWALRMSRWKASGSASIKSFATFWLHARGAAALQFPGDYSS